MSDISSIFSSSEDAVTLVDLPMDLLIEVVSFCQPIDLVKLRTVVIVLLNQLKQSNVHL
jgi:hypothetical protein